MSEKKRIVIVGGVAGGASAAARARRLSEDAEIIMFERGEHISFANCGLPYHIGGVIKSAIFTKVKIETVIFPNGKYIDIGTPEDLEKVHRKTDVLMEG